MSPACIHVVLDDTAVVAADRGNILASRLIRHSHAEPGWFIYTTACALVEVDQARQGTAERIAAPAQHHGPPPDPPAALAVARESPGLSRVLRTRPGPVWTAPTER